MRTSLFVLTVALALIASTSANTFVKRFHANTSNVTNTTTIRIPNYGNNVPRVVNCSKNATYCSGADNRSTITIPHIYAYNLSATVNSSGSGVLNGNLEFIYNATYHNGTNATIINGWNYMYFTGKVSKTGVNGTYQVEVEPHSLPHVSNDNSSFVFYAAQKLFYNHYSFEVQRYVNKFFAPNTTNTTNATQTIYLPNYSNASVKSVNCSHKWWTCSGADNRSALNTSNVESKNLSITIDTTSGSGYLNGYLIVPYSARLLNTTRNSDIQETLDSAFRGQANLTVWGKVERTGATGVFRVEVEPAAYGNVTLDRNYFAANAVKDLYYNFYSWELQQHINAYFQNTTLAKTHASIKGKVFSI